MTSIRQTSFCVFWPAGRLAGAGRHQWAQTAYVTGCAVHLPVDFPILRVPPPPVAAIEIPQLWFDRQHSFINSGRRHAGFFDNAIENAAALLYSNAYDFRAVLQKIQ